MDATSSSQTNLIPPISNPLYDDHSEDVVLSSEKKVEEATVEAKTNYAEAVSKHRILTNKVIEIRSLNPNHQKIDTYGVCWFGFSNDQEILVGQHIRFPTSMHEELLSLTFDPDLKDHINEEYEVLKVTLVYSDGKEECEEACNDEELALKLAAAYEAEEAFDDEKLALKLAAAYEAEYEAEAEEVFNDEKLALKLAAYEAEEAFNNEKLARKLADEDAQAALNGDK